MSDGIHLVKLHDYPHLLKACVQLLNEEWPRSETARIHSLSQSRDSLPMSLILIDGNNQLIGHVKLKRESLNTRSAFIESLIVDKGLRGKGFGKYIMKHIECLAKELGLDKLVLTTTDKIGFYESLGFLISETLEKHVKSKVSHLSDFTQVDNISNHKTSTLSHLSSNPKSSPPPPPPLPRSLNLDSNQNYDKNTGIKKTLMHKFI